MKFIVAEIDFWNLRNKNLQYIYQQLREARIKSMALILEKTNSAYYSCYQTIFKNVVLSLAEAKNICLYLTPLRKHISLLEETEFNECVPFLAPLMHVLCLIWANSSYYNENKLIVLLKQVCNLLIQQAKKFLDPTTLFHSDVDEAMHRVVCCIKVLKKFQNIFDFYREHMHKFTRNGQLQPWNFHPNIIFCRYNAFLERLEIIGWFFNTVLEFSRLEKVEIGGMKGKILSARVSAVSAEFHQHMSTFSGKSHDVLDPDESSFAKELEVFKKKTYEMDMKLSAVLCQAFEDCTNLESIYKVMVPIIGILSIFNFHRVFGTF